MYLSPGAKFDSSLAHRFNMPLDTVPVSLILARYHYRISPLENLKFRYCLLRGQKYTPKLTASAGDAEKYLSVDGSMEDYDPRSDPWPAS